MGRVDAAIERLGGQWEERVGNQDDINVPHMLNCDETRFTGNLKRPVDSERLRPICDSYDDTLP